MSTSPLAEASHFVSKCKQQFQFVLDNPIWSIYFKDHINQLHFIRDKNNVNDWMTYKIKKKIFLFIIFF